MNTGLVQVYTGEGKGKTTAAFGLAVRAAGRGLKVVIIQFFKADQTGEVLLLQDRTPEIEIIACSSQNKFSWNMNDSEIAILKKETEAGFKLAEEKITARACDVLILDEVTYALNQTYINVNSFVELLKLKPATMEIVITGRDAPSEIVAVADLVTEMKKIKHPYDKGVLARIGIEK